MIRTALLLSFLAPQLLAADDVRVGPVFPAAGRHRNVVALPRLGRYSLAVKSACGVALTIVDRMSGPGERDGAPGDTDGRAEVALDRGDVRLVLNGDQKAKGRATLSARPFGEGTGATPSRIVEGKQVETTLGDYEQPSWWIAVECRGNAAGETADLRLSDLRL